MNSFVSQLFSVENKIVLSTGASKGIGAAVADGFIQAGAFVIGVSRIQPVDAHKFHQYYQADLSDSESIEKVFSKIKEEHPLIHVLINAAGMTQGYIENEYSENLKNFKKTQAVNVTAPFMIIEILKKNLIATKASVINMTSIGQDKGFPNNPAYVSSKGALRQLTSAYAVDLAKYQIRVNNVVPGYIHTDMTAKSFNDPVLHQERKQRMLLDRWGEPTDLIGACLFLASSASSYMTGSSLIVDGGWLAKGL
jgi:NAD(P)-dependent dehydrogenase (short-subunit alcohol dehydrogenase family)